MIFLGVVLVISALGPLSLDLQPYDLGDDLLREPGWTESGLTLGTDDLGRDLLSRLVHGGRSSLGIGFAVMVVSMAIGTLLGLLAGVYGGWISTFITRTTDVIMSLPSILLAIVLVSVLGGGLFNAMLAVTIVAIPRFVRVVRAVVLVEMKKQYVLAARTSGASRFRILWSEVLPNCWPPIGVQATLSFSDAVLEIGALGFLGLGAKPPVAEWGAMLADARPFLESHPHLALLPGLCVFATVLAINLCADQMQEDRNIDRAKSR